MEYGKLNTLLTKHSMIEKLKKSIQLLNIKNIVLYIYIYIHKLSHSQDIQICRLPSSRPCKKTTFLYQGHHRLYQQN